MRHSGGGSWVYLTLLAACACSSAEPPPPEGGTNGSVNYSGKVGLANINGGTPSNLTNHIFGKTVLDGRDGYHVSCNINGGSVSGSISSQDGTSLTVDGSGITTQGGTVSMSFYVNGIVNTVKDKNCTLTQVGALEPGSIWAAYNCANVAAESVIGTPGTARGEFTFTGCTR